jgi:hypothetical protein
MSATDRYKVNAPDVAWEAFDGEVVIINLQSGHYFSARGTAALIWRALMSGASRPEVDALMDSTFDASPSDMRAPVHAFLSDLVERTLIVPLREGHAASPNPSPELSPATSKVPFSPPVLDTYADMQDILLLDPIHEVDDQGWPHQR